jgi:hypothetical protein
MQTFSYGIPGHVFYAEVYDPFRVHVAELDLSFIVSVAAGFVFRFVVFHPSTMKLWMDGARRFVMGTNGWSGLFMECCARRRSIALLRSVGREGLPSILVGPFRETENAVLAVRLLLSSKGAAIKGEDGKSGIEIVASRIRADAS